MWNAGVYQFIYLLLKPPNLSFEFAFFLWFSCGITVRIFKVLLQNINNVRSREYPDESGQVSARQDSLGEGEARRDSAQTVTRRNVKATEARTKEWTKENRGRFYAGARICAEP